MFPIKMSYQGSIHHKKITVDVYHFTPMLDDTHTVLVTYVTAWDNKNKLWITAPIEDFKPIQTKVLKEGQ